MKKKMDFGSKGSSISVYFNPTSFIKLLFTSRHTEKQSNTNISHAAQVTEMLNITKHRLITAVKI